MGKKTGKQSVIFENPPHILEAAAIGGKKESEGPLAAGYDMLLEDEYFGEDSWEMAESNLQKQTVELLLRKSKMPADKPDFILSGDLQNQCVGSHYSMRDFEIPFIGLYGACSTMTESLMLSAMMIDGGFAEYIMCGTSSHFCAAEKQFRFPLEYGGVRTPTSQWTVTGSGFALLGKNGDSDIKITGATAGRIVDMGVTDINNMGAAMAPAAADTLTAHFEDTGIKPSEYDLILTGDLGVIGSDLLKDIMNERGYDIYPNHNDCGMLVYDRQKQDVHAGGSGCGCCASVFCGRIFKDLKEKKYKKIAVMATGALMNPQVVLQGQSIPCVAHLVTIEV